MPTFQIFQQGQQVEQIVGADAKSLEALCIKYNSASSVFSGQGRKLGSVSLTSKSPCSMLMQLSEQIHAMKILLPLFTHPCTVR